LLIIGFEPTCYFDLLPLALTCGVSIACTSHRSFPTSYIVQRTTGPPAANSHLPY